MQTYINEATIVWLRYETSDPSHAYQSRNTHTHIPHNDTRIHGTMRTLLYTCTHTHMHVHPHNHPATHTIPSTFYHTHTNSQTHSAATTTTFHHQVSVFISVTLQLIYDGINCLLIIYTLYISIHTIAGSYLFGGVKRNNDTCRAQWWEVILRCCSGRASVAACGRSLCAKTQQREDITFWDSVH